MDQDLGINAPVKYTIQGGILPFLVLNPETAEVAIARPLYEHELRSPATIVVKASSACIVPNRKGRKIPRLFFPHVICSLPTLASFKHATKACLFFLGVLKTFYYYYC